MYNNTISVIYENIFFCSSGELFSILWFTLLTCFINILNSFPRACKSQKNPQQICKHQNCIVEESNRVKTNYRNCDWKIYPRFTYPACRLFKYNKNKAYIDLQRRYSAAYRNVKIFIVSLAEIRSIA